MKITKNELPEQAYSKQYADNGAFTDCYHVDIARSISLTDYLQAFYTTAIFKIERTILSTLTGQRADDRSAAQLASGQTDRFSIWRVEQRAENQILLCDMTQSTRSWLMVTPADTNSRVLTRLYFGSVVMPSKRSDNGQSSFGPLFHTLSGFHRLYSRALLASAAKKLLKQNL
ncbi:hypothetical protein [Gynuella sp.]|uniref:hypothetical protein n=1 Tax=Gynuella sp. TaxID=2969146 RepID=UPI003D1275FF